ncbi:MAG: hypothetical protein Kow0089_12320 [Desulfobulbaceae bacterium]
MACLRRKTTVFALLAALLWQSGPAMAQATLPPLDIPGNVPPAGQALPPEEWGELPPLPPLEEEHDEEKHTVWTCSMHPNIQLPEFGQCPICFMDLIEVEVGGGSALTSLRQVELSDEARKLAMVETVPVTRDGAAIDIRMVGKIDYDETRVGSITAWINGRIDTLHVAYTGSRVRAGQPMAEIYSPELLAAQAELIEAAAAMRKLNGSANDLLRRTISRTEQAARKKLRLLGLTDSQIEEVSTRGTPSDHVTLTAPISGVVIRKEVTEGMYVKTGAPIYTIADLSRLWVILEAYESDLHAIGLGQPVEFTAQAFPGRRFTGTISYIDPVVNDRTRTVRVRLDIDNPDLLLKPGMFVRALTRSMARTGLEEEPLLIPATAPLMTGKRAIVYVEVPDREGTYEGREIVLGPRRGDFYEVVSGLAEGEQVVTRGNFKIDSAVQIQGRPSMMSPYLAREPFDPDTLQPLFVSKLKLMNEVFLRYSRAVHDDDQKGRLHHLDTFEKILTSIQSDFFDKEVKLDWQELAMTLTADLVLLRQAADREELLRAFAETASHFYQVRTRFQLPPPVLEREGSDELRRALGSLLGRYLTLQRHLADDAEEKSLEVIPSLLEEMKNYTGQLAESGSDKASSIQAELTDAAAQLAKSTNIAELRTGFYPLSRGMVSSVAAFGVPAGSPVYEHYCPMAFNDTGANWLDTSETISNPYFGDEMLRCGEVLSQLTLEEQE